MISSIKILIKEEVSEDLALRDSARKFFIKIESAPEKEITVDFRNVHSISRSFAHEYVTRKNKSNKLIKEINVPYNIRKMFEVVEEPKEKRIIVNLSLVRPVSL